MERKQQEDDKEMDFTLKNCLRGQLEKNMTRMQFRKSKKELLKAISIEDDEQKLIIEAKPKKPNQSMSEDAFRGSRYRGVSKNKNKWQMMIMMNQKKVYMGTISNEIDAARYYDQIAIMCQGLSAKTNFEYTGKEIKMIIKDYDIEN